MANLVEQVVEVFRQFDTRGEGTVTRNEMLQVLQSLDSTIWGEEQVDLLLRTFGLEESSTIAYEQLVKWIMGAPEGPLMGDPVCQAAFEGSLLTLKELLSMKGVAAVTRASGYVQVNGEIVGMWTMIPHTFQLKPVREDPNITTGNPLHWAAFGGHAHVVKFLLGECGMKKDAEGSFGWLPYAISSSHRLGLEGDVIEDNLEVQGLLDDGDGTPLCPTSLQKAVTKGLGATN